jgi:hypothetical protein
MFITYVSWFSFFVTINFVVAGWFSGKVMSRRGVSVVGVLIVAGYFILQGGISAYGTVRLWMWYGDLAPRLAELMKDSSPMEQAVIVSAISNYRLYLILFFASLISLVVFWVAIVALAYFRENSLFGEHPTLPGSPAARPTG